MNDDNTKNNPIDPGDDDNSGNGGSMPEADIPLENVDPTSPPNNEEPDGM